MEPFILLSLTADVIGVLGAGFAAVAWWNTRKLREAKLAEEIRQNRKIRVVLHHGGDKIELPFEFRRAEFTRQEVLGRIGMIPMCEEKKNKRFEIRFLNTSAFLARVNQIIDGQTDDVLIIPISNEEYRQWDMPEFRRLNPSVVLGSQ